VEFSRFRNTRGRGRVAGGYGGGEGVSGYDKCGSVLYFYGIVGADLWGRDMIWLRVKL